MITTIKMATRRKNPQKSSIAYRRAARLEVTAKFACAVSKVGEKNTRTYVYRTIRGAKNLVSSLDAGIDIVLAYALIHDCIGNRPPVMVPFAVTRPTGGELVEFAQACVDAFEEEWSNCVKSYVQQH